jgi:DNA-nicking Smr family endonuclease
MAKRPLSSSEQAVWGRVAETVRPLLGREKPKSPTLSLFPELVEGPSFGSGSARQIKVRPFDIDPLGDREGKPEPRRIKAPPEQNTLDANWDKRIATGKASPDRTIDLHGHTASSAHAVLNHLLGDAIRSGARVVLLITGRPARDNPRMPPTGRGVIRASVEDWLLAGPYSSQIAAIRGAHPRHGGAGALYLVIRRDRAF